jgi:CubicO group peptidase (beta-lactamase class C family)/D-alanyl-D-alanine dipeptidase
MTVVRQRIILAALLAAATFSAWTALRARTGFQAATAVESRYAAVVGQLADFVKREMADKRLPAVSVALVDDQKVVWAQGFGLADPVRRIPATADTVYRVGSVSKLFTDIAIMQLTERGRVDLDAPVARYLPGFQPRNPFPAAITLRHLMSHRAGLVREPPVGHYFDDTGASLANTVTSLNRTDLVYAPGARTKYSNAGIAVVGRVVEELAGRPFPEVLADRVLGPLDMTSSAFEPTPIVRERLAKAVMWTLHGTEFAAPAFELGMSPAGSMYSTVTDLAKFMSALFARGHGSGGAILKPDTLEAMWKPQFADADATTGFGLGFHVGRFEGRRRVGHDGAIYGFATALDTLPDDKLGVVVVTTVDCANAVMDRIAEQALGWMLAARQGRRLAETTAPVPVGREIASRLAGSYDTEGSRIDFTARGERLLAQLGSARVELRRLGSEMIADDRLLFGPRLRVRDDGKIEMDSRVLNRIADHIPMEPPQRWAGLIGEYGWDHDVLYVLERDGVLHALIEWFFLYPLEQIEPDVYAFPKSGLYDGERLRFVRGADGTASAVDLGGIRFERRPAGLHSGTFRITPVVPLDELRRAAESATPPVERGKRAPDLVELASLDPTIKYDIRYATDNNFLGAPVYRSARALLQRPAAEALVRAHQRLAARGYGLLIHDAYRPWAVTRIFWDATPPDKHVFVADPSEGSRHNRGCAVDLTLYERSTGMPVTMVGGYDEMSDRSYPDYPGGSSRQRWHRELLRVYLEAEGFTVYEAEWWHFDYTDWEQYPLLNVPFESLGSERRTTGRPD